MFINTRDVHRQTLITSSRIPQWDCSTCLHPRLSHAAATKSRASSLTYTRERSDSRNSSLAVRVPLPARLASEREVPHPLQVLISHHFQMTPLLRWVFLLVLVGCAASIPSALVDDACVLLCHPRTRSSPEGVCELRRAQSGSVLDLARIIVSRCLKLCNHRQPSYARVSCFALRSFLGVRRGCHCPSTRFMRTSARIPSLVDELAEDVVFSSLGGVVISALHAALLREDADTEGYDLVVDYYGSGSRLAQDAEDEGPKRHDVEQPPMGINGHGTVLLQNERTDSNALSGFSEGEDDINWKQWCMEQCNIGRGGKACNCDILPWFSPRTVRRHVEEEVTRRSSHGRAWIYISCRLIGPMGQLG